jgi:hypothetical protein
MRTANLSVLPRVSPCLILLISVGVTPVKAERVWDGFIHFVDAKIILDFHGVNTG